MIPTEILKQARVALDQAAQIIFLIDGRTEITGTDRDLAKVLRKLGKPVTLAVNKIDATVREGLAHEFHSLGFKDLFPDLVRASDRVRRAAGARHAEISAATKGPKSRSPRSARSRLRSSAGRTSENPRC